MVPIRAVAELVEAEAIPEANLGLLRADRLRNYLYLPAGGGLTQESVGLLYMPLTIHHDVIAQNRTAQLSSAAYWHLRSKLVAYSTGLVIPSTTFGAIPPDTERRD